MSSVPIKTYRMGMEKVMRGILQYRNTVKGDMVKEFIKVRN